jgi:integrase
MTGPARVSVVDPGGDRPNFRLRYRDPVTQIQHWRSAKTTIYREAERAAARWEEEISSGKQAPVGRIRWDAFVKRVKAELLPGLADKTAKNYTTVLNTVERILKAKQLAAITAGRLSDFAAQLRDEEKSENTIKSYLGQLQAMLSWAKRIGLIAFVPELPQMRRVRGSWSPMKGRPITEKEYKAILKAVPKVVGDKAAPSWRHWLEGLWWSGLRLEESLNLYWDQADRIQVDTSGEFPMLVVPRNMEKAHKDRLLPMAPEFAEFLLKTPEADRHGPVFRPRAVECPDAKGGRPRSVGGLRDPDWVGTVCRRIGKKADVVVDRSDKGRIKWASAHDFRRAFGVRWAARVMPPVLMELMRHEDIKTTMKYYVGQDSHRTAKAAWDAYRLTGGKVAAGSVSGSVGRKVSDRRKNVNAVSGGAINS